MTDATDRPIAFRAFSLWVAAFVLLSGRSSSQLYAQDQGVALKERFKEEAPKAWQNYQTRAKELQGTLQFKRFSLSPERKLAKELRYEFKEKPGRALYMEQHIPTADSREQDGALQVTNPDYAFSLRRHAQNHPWVLTRVIPRSTKELPFEDPAASIDQWTTSPVTFSSLWPEVGNVVQESGYKSTGFSVLEIARQKCIKVQFTYTPDGKNLRIPAITGYSVYSPAEYWVAKEHTVSMTWAARPGMAVNKAVKMEYVESLEGFPIIKRVVVDYHATGENKSVHLEFQYAFDLGQRDVDDEDFTLSAYGLPEPPRTWKTLYYWIAAFAVIGVACLALSTLIRWRKRLRSSAALTQEQKEKPQSHSIE